MPRRSRPFILLTAAAVALVVAATAPSLAATAPGEASAGMPPAAISAAGHGTAGRVEYADVADLDALRRAITAAGGAIEVVADDRVQARFPGGAAPDLDGVGGARRDRPAQMLPLQVPDVGQAGRQIGADRWQAAGFSGHDVQIAVVDTGFLGYQGLLGSGLPADVQVRSFRADRSLVAGSDHGTRAAEIVHRMAPGAALHLLAFSTVTELSALVDFVIAEEIDIVSFSIGFIHNGPGDGTGPVDAVVSRAVSAGVLWVSAAGNWAQQHWTGPYRDTDGDGVHEFVTGVQSNGRDYVAGDLIIVSLRWDAPWGAACSDYDIELFGPSGALVRAARGIQGCRSDPVEGLRVLATETGHYTVRIVQAQAARNHQLSLLMLGTPDRSEPLDRAVASGSLAQPADHPGVLAVGALASSGTRQASFSSRALAGGRAKPEILAPTNGGEPENPMQPVAFAGTSAAAPHVAGAAALLREALWYPSASALRDALLGRALDLGAGRPVVALGGLAGVGRLLPVGADEARIAGNVPSGPGIAVAQYRGPDGYPPRFLHRLLDGRTVRGVYRVQLPLGRWSVYLRGAPDFVNSLRTVDDGDLLLLDIAE